MTRIVRRRSVQWLSLAVAFTPACGWSRAAEPMPLADRVPAGVLFYTAWAGQNAMPPEFADTHVSLLLNALNLDGWTQDGLFQMLPPNASANPAVPLLVDLAKTIVRYAWENSSAVYSNGRGMTEALQPAPHLCFLIRFPDNDAADDAERDIQDRITAIIGGEAIPNLRLFRSGATLALTANDTTDTSPLAELRKPLASDPEFIAAFERTARAGDTPAVRTYVNLERVWLYADEYNLDNPEYERNMAIAGLKQARAVVLSAGPNGADWSSNLFIQMDPNRSGILGAVATPRPVSGDLLAGVPATATSVLTFSADAADLLRRLQTEGERFSRGFSRQVLGAVNLAGAVLGVNAIDLVSNIGPDFVLYALPASPDEAKGFDYILLTKPRNAANLATSLFTVGQSLQRLILAQRPDLPALIVNQAEKAGATLYTAAVGSFTAAWTAADGYFVFATSDATLQRALTSMNAPRLTDHEPFRQAVARLGAPDGASLGYANLAATLSPMHAAWTHAFSGQFPNLPPNLRHLPIPSLEQLKPHTTLAVSATWADDAGLHYRALSPYPGAEMFSSSFGLLIGPDSVISQVQAFQRSRRTDVGLDDEANASPREAAPAARPRRLSR